MIKTLLAIAGFAIAVDVAAELDSIKSSPIDLSAGRLMSWDQKSDSEVQELVLYPKLIDSIIKQGNPESITNLVSALAVSGKICDIRGHNFQTFIGPEHYFAVGRSEPLKPQRRCQTCDLVQTFYSEWK